MQKDLSTNKPDTEEMPEITDFSGAIAYKDFREARKQTTIRLKASTIYYFQSLATETGIPYQTLINMYLDDCAKNKRRLEMEWK